MLLLDGLDEVSEDRRNDCVIAINEFKQSHGVTEIVVCSRIKDYEAFYSRLKFQGAIFIEDLTLEQINDYFDNAADKLQGVKTAWMNDDVLQELTKTPSTAIRPFCLIGTKRAIIGLAESVPRCDAVWVMRSQIESMVQEKQVK
ncbi:hypothetical protein BCD67_21435 [Oscillatoriales cyanobacterium USR001]|nr:hypothetical protein BCD67_21435 [Oscillatoriales cyanobacterium USR001]